jgi:hypothetical protein
MLNWIWLALVVLAVAIGGWNNRLGEVRSAAHRSRAGAGARLRQEKEANFSLASGLTDFLSSACT